MPELAEIEANRRSLEACFGLPSTSVKIAKCITSNPFDAIIFDESCTKADLTKNVAGKTVTACCRKGKQMWIELSSGMSLLLHMGMTGALVIENEKIPQYKAFKVDAKQWPPRFTKLEMELSNGARIAFCDPRRLGRVKLRKTPALESPPLSNLALDPYLEAFDSEYLASKLNNTSAPIKAILLEQDRVFSGIGNYLADEVLYQAAIHPKAASNTLSGEQIEALTKSIKYVVNTAVDFHCSGKDFPDSWIFHKRWSKGQKIIDNKLNGRSVTFETVGGRTSAVVVGWQKMGCKAKNNHEVKVKAENDNQSDSLIESSGNVGKIIRRGKRVVEEPNKKKKAKPASVDADAVKADKKSVPKDKKSSSRTIELKRSSKLDMNKKRKRKSST